MTGGIKTTNLGEFEQASERVLLEIDPGASLRTLGNDQQFDLTEGDGT